MRVHVSTLELTFTVAYVKHHTNWRVKKGSSGLLLPCVGGFRHRQVTWALELPLGVTPVTLRPGSLGQQEAHCAQLGAAEPGVAVPLGRRRLPRGRLPRSLSESAAEGGREG